MRITNNSISDLLFSFTTLSSGDSMELIPAQFTPEEWGGVVINGINSGEIIVSENGIQLDISTALFKLSQTPTIELPQSIGIPSTIESWGQWGEILGYDYKFVRDRIIEIVSVQTLGYTDYSTLNSNEINISMKYVAVPRSYIEANAINPDYIINKWDEYSTKARQIRWNKTRQYVLNNLEVNEARDLIHEVTEVKNLVTRYLLGIESKDIDGQIGLFDFIESKYDYLLTGLSSKSYTPRNGLSMSDFIDGVIDVIKYGIY